MANKIEIDIVANDKTSGAIKGISGSFTELNSAIMIGEKVLGYMAKAYEMTAGAAQTYDQQVYELMLKTGGTADETSRLIQVIDDTGIEYSVLETAMKFAVKNGIEPNIESLAKLSDEYKALSSPVEQGQLLMAKFGRSGLEMTRAMDMGGDALRKMNSEMSGGLILTEANIKASEEYRKNLDTMNDSVLGLKVSIGNELIPALNEQVLESNALIKSLQEQGYWYTMLHQWSIRSAASKNAEVVEVDSATQSYTAMAQAIEAETNASALAAVATDEEIAAMKELQVAQEGLLKNALWLTDNQKKYNASLADLKSQRQEEIGTLGLMLATYGTANSAIDGQRKKIQDLDQSIQDLEDSQVEQTNKWVMNLLVQQGATVEMQMAYANAAGLISDQTVGMVTSIGEITTQFKNGKLTAQQYRHEVAQLLARIQAINGVEAYANIYITTYGKIPSFGQGEGTIAGGGAYAGSTQIKYKAAGGPVSANTPYIVGEVGQELFVPSQNGSIIPNNKLGGSTVINLTYAPMFSTVDKYELQDKLRPFIESGIRQYRSALA